VFETLAALMTILFVVVFAGLFVMDRNSRREDPE
jgi:hypothetical protein